MSRTTTQVNSASMEPAAFKAIGEVVTAAERCLASEHSLLSAADDVNQARQEWHREGIALLRCGGLFGAIRINSAIKYAAAGADDFAAVDQYLAEALLGKPIFTEQESQRHNALVGVSAGWRNDRERPGHDAEYWCVEMDRPGGVVVAEAVSQLVHIGSSRLFKEQSGR